MPSDNLTEAIRLVAADRPAVVLRYRDNANLRRLWHLDAAWEDADHVIVIDTDEVCNLLSRGIGRALSALDWANLYSVRAAAEGRPVPQIEVLDLRSPPRSGPGLPSVVMRNVRYHAPYQLGSVRSVERFASDLSARKREPAQDEESSFVATSWLGSLSLSNTREGAHQLNNSVAPLALALGLPQSIQAKVLPQLLECFAGNGPERFTREVLLQALKWALDPRGAEARGSALETLCGELNDVDEIRFLLVDDQADEGWVPLLAALFDLELSSGREVVRGRFIPRAEAVLQQRRVTLWTSDSPDPVLETLERDPGSARFASLRFTDAGQGRCVEVLLLDLRLFAGGRDAEEEAFFRRVGRLLQSESLPAHWLQHIGSEDFAESAHYLDALSGLARVISAVDATYPVVVWSSTGQRRVVDSLRACANVYTTLDKPRFDPYFHRVDGFVSSFADATAWCRERVIARNYLSRITERAGTDNAYAGPDLSRHRYAEIYLEEDGNPRNQDSQTQKSAFRVGAIIAFYPRSRAADELHQAMSTDQFGPSEFFWTKANQDSFERNPAIKEGEAAQPLEKRSWKNENGTPMSFCGERRLPKKLDFGPGGIFDVGGRNAADNPRVFVADKLREMLERADVECVFFSTSDDARPEGPIDYNYPILLSETLKMVFCLLFDAPLPVRVYVATRQGVCKPGRPSWELYDSYGVLPSKAPRGDDNVYYSLTNHSAFMPVLSAHEYAASVSRSARVEAARGVTLSYKKSAPNAHMYEWLLLKAAAAQIQNQAWNSVDRSLEGLRSESHVLPAPVPAPAWTGTGAGADLRQLWTTTKMRIARAMEEDTLSIYTLLANAFPSIRQSSGKPRHWRNLHYFADDFMEGGAREAYGDAGVVPKGAWFEHVLDVNRSTSTSLCEAARLARDSAKLPQALGNFARAVPASRIGNLTTLEAFLASRLARGLAGASRQIRAAAYAQVVAAQRAATGASEAEQRP